MKNINTIIFLIGILLVSCGGPKYLVKQGQKSEKARDYETAVGYYSEAYAKDPGNKDAVKGMRKAGQKLLNIFMDDFEESYRVDNYRQAITHYRKADKLVTGLEKKKVYLSIPDSVQLQYNDALAKHTRTLYLEAARNLDAMNYSKASELTRELEKYDPDYDGLRNLKKAIEVDPIYNQAIASYKKGEKAKAIMQFMDVESVYPDYRETTKFINELKSTSQIKLVKLPFINMTYEAALARDLEMMVETELYRLKNPLVLIADPASMGYQHSATGSWPDDQTLINMAKNAGVTNIIMVSVMDFKVENLPRSEFSQNAFIREQYSFYDPFMGNQTITRWRDTQYRDITEEVKINVQVKYRLLFTKDGRSATDILTKSVINQTRYAEYNGPIESLYPTNGYISQSDLRNWRNRFYAAQDRKPVSELVKIANQELVNELMNVILTKSFE